METCGDPLVKLILQNRNEKVGDIMLLADEGYPPVQCRLEMVVEDEASEDGYVQTVKVRSSCTVTTGAKRRRKEKYASCTTILTRPVTTLCLLVVTNGQRLN